MTVVPVPEKKKRGRPPGSLNKNPTTPHSQHKCKTCGKPKLGHERGICRENPSQEQPEAGPSDEQPAPTFRFKNKTERNYQNGSFQSSGEGTSAQRNPVPKLRWRIPKVATPEANTPEASSPGGLRMDTPSVYTPEPLPQTPPNPGQFAGGHGQYQDRDPFIVTSSDADPVPGPEYSELFFHLFPPQDGSKPDDPETIDPRLIFS